MLKKGDIVIRTTPFTTGGNARTIEQHEGAIFEATKDSKSSEYVYYGECYNTIHWRKAERLEKIAYRRGLRNINNISWNIPAEPHFAVALTENSLQDPMLRHTAYKEICEQLSFGPQYGNYDNCTYAGYKYGSARTWTHSPNFEGMKFESVLKFIDYIFEHWMIIDLPEAVSVPMGIDTLDAKDWVVMVVGQDQYNQLATICENNNIPLYEFSNDHYYYGVHHGKAVSSAISFINEDQSNYYITYFKLETDNPGEKYGSKPEPIEIEIKAEPYPDTSRDWCVFVPMELQHKGLAEICKREDILLASWVDGQFYYGVHHGSIVSDSVRFINITQNNYYNYYGSFENDSPKYKYGRKPKREREPVIGDYIGKYFIHEEDEEPVYYIDSVANGLVLITWGGCSDSPGKYTEDKVIELIKTGIWKLVNPPKQEIRTAVEWPSEGCCDASHSGLAMIADYMVNMPSHWDITRRVVNGNAVGIAWNERGYWYYNTVSKKYRFQWLYIEQLIKNLSSNQFNNNHLKNSKKDENVFTKISGSTQRRSNNRTRQTSIRRKPNSTTKRCFRDEERIREKTQRVGQTSRSKRDRL